MLERQVPLEPAGLSKKESTVHGQCAANVSARRTGAVAGGGQVLLALSALLFFVQNDFILGYSAACLLRSALTTLCDI